jgi:alkanesulfonate monooxygenase SsuD/methylene tetrahydromethanopterin reductase-like flavin-dependent oxidoreductase (luciferase family)
MDRLSDGRLLMGMASGWYKREFDAIGVPFDKPIIQWKKPLNVILQIAAHYSDTGAIFRGRLYWFPLIHRLLAAGGLRNRCSL